MCQAIYFFIHSNYIIPALKWINHVICYMEGYKWLDPAELFIIHVLKMTPTNTSNGG